MSNKKRLKEHTSASLVMEIATADEQNKPKTLFRPNEKIVISSKVAFNASLKKPAVQLWFSNPGGTAIASTMIKNESFLKQKVKLDKPVTVSWILDGIYNDGKYLVTVEVSDEADGTVYETLREGFEFDVIGWESPYVIVHPQQNIKVTQ